MEKQGPTQTWHKRDTCRACDGPNLTSVLDLGEQPLANDFRKPGDPNPQYSYPLHLVRCLDCELLQITAVVDPKVMYGPSYKYRSGYAEGWVLHCHGLAKEIGKGKRVLEIGCLDGVMLKHCSENGCDVLGVDPSAPDLPLPVLRELWRAGIALPHPSYDVIVAQNVFGHVDDAKGFLRAARRYLATDGTLIIECPWVVDLVDGVQWDQVYHEHLSYWGLRSMMRIAQAERLVVRDIRYFQHLHGGTMRYYLAHPNRHVNVKLFERWRDEEMGDSDWRRFHERFLEQREYWSRMMLEFFETRKRVAAYGASAKLNVFLNALDTNARPIDMVLDDNPTKRGLLTPGWRIPVLEPTRERMAEIDILLIGAANWKAEIEQKARDLGFQGEVVALWQ